MNLLFLGTPEEADEAWRLKSLVGAGHRTYLAFQYADTLAEVLFYCKKKEITGVITTQANLIPKITGEEYGQKKPSLNDYAGSLIHRSGVDFVFINPLEHLRTVSHGKFLAARYISKLVSPESWHRATPFSWEIATEASIAALYERFQDAFLISVDIETASDPLRITVVGYTGVFLDSAGNITTHSIVVPFSSEYFVSWVRKFNGLRGAKIFQNGKYDNAYLSRYGCVVENWLWDTATMMHSTYSELPKDLAFLNAFWVREARYWKHEADTSNFEDYCLYNAHDTHATANAAIAWFLSAPDWAKKNYLMEFPLNFPCHLAEMTGLKVDMGRVREVAADITGKIEQDNATLSAMLGVKNFNTNSPKQVRQMLDMLGCKDIRKGDEKSLVKCAARHPLNRILVDRILQIRGDRKLVSTYLKDSIEFNGRVLYSLNPHGTDTGRLASKEHHFWCGLQIQNIPREGPVKEGFIADDGFLLGEADFEQAESRDTAYISGDENLLAAVESDRDFHCLNASAFFGIPYEELIDVATGKKLNKPIRDLSKRVNHGANYNMGWAVLVETMGEENVYKAKRLLNLPKLWTVKQVAEYLLACFDKTYPRVRSDYYTWVKYQVDTYMMLVGATGWTRYCFGHPSVNKQDLNAYVAHCPQSLNAMMLNRGFMRVFYEVWMPNPRDFRLHAQIHDSILFSYRIGREDLAWKVKECMENPVQVTDVNGITRTLLVPAALKLGGSRWSECKEVAM